MIEQKKKKKQEAGQVNIETPFKQTSPLSDGVMEPSLHLHGDESFRIKDDEKDP